MFQCDVGLTEARLQDLAEGDWRTIEVPFAPQSHKGRVNMSPVAVSSGSGFDPDSRFGHEGFCVGGGLVPPDAACARELVRWCGGNLLASSGCLRLGMRSSTPQASKAAVTMRHVALCFGHAFDISRPSTWTLSHLGSTGAVTTLSAWRFPRFRLAPKGAKALRSKHCWPRP